MSLVGFDSETHLLKAGCVAPRPVVFSFNNGTQLLALRDDAHQIIESYLSGPQTLVAHNLAYDLVVAAAEWPRLLRSIMDAVDARRARCTFIRQGLIDIAAGESEFRRVWTTDVNGHVLDYKVTKAGKGLDDLGLLYFNEAWAKGAETHRLRYGELDGVPLGEWPREAREYPLQDAERPRRVFEAQRGRAEELRARPEMEGVWDSEPGEIPDELPQTRGALWLQLMSSWGFRTDPVAVAELKAEHEAEQAEVKRRLLPTGMVREDGSRDMKEIRTRVVAAYAARGEEPPGTAKGQVSTSGEVLIDSGDPDLVLLGESLSDAATIGTWLPHLEAGTRLPVCVGYNPLVDSGRASARAPNIQNPPRKGKIRACVVPRDRTYLAASDLDTAELRALAQVCIWLELPYRDLADALIAGEDPHLSLAADMEGITYSEALARSRAGDKEIKDTRQLCKVPNFGLPGGLGAEKLVMYAHGYDPRFKKIVDLRMARRLISAWHRRWREMRSFFSVVEQAVGKFGEGAIQQFWSKRVRGGCGRNQALNTTFQGLVADGAKRAGWMLARECYLGDRMYPPADADDGSGPSPLLGSRPIIFMHDEFILEVPDEPRRASSAAERLAHVMRSAVQEVIPDVPIKSTPVLMRRWLKGCEQVRLDGLIVPSRPVDADGRVRWVHDA